MSLNNEPCMITSILIDLNFIELNYHEITISLDKYSKRCNVVDDLYAKICASSEIKDVTAQVCNVLTRINEAKSICKTYFT